jgi:hypothetical protein
MRISRSETAISVTCLVEERSGSLMVVRRGRWESQESDGELEQALLSATEEQVSTLPPSNHADERSYPSRLTLAAGIARASGPRNRRCRSAHGKEHQSCRPETYTG